MRTKEELRNIVRTRKRQMSPMEIREKSEIIFQNLEKLSVYEQSQWIFSYVSYNQEVDTGRWLEGALKKQKRIAVPKVTGNEISFFEITDLKQLSKGYQGILEPNTSVCVDGTDALILMPGLAFDRLYHRCGYGGGYYDRYLQKFSKTKMHTVALGYDFQIFDEIPYEDHDRLVDYIITETGILQRKNGVENG